MLALAGKQFDEPAALPSFVQRDWDYQPWVQVTGLIEELVSIFPRKLPPASSVWKSVVGT